MAPASYAAIQIRDDSRTLAALAAGDSRAVVDLYREHSASVYRFIARRVSGPVEDIEEILQDTMMAAVTGASRFRGECGVRTWLCSIARRQILQRRRTEVRKKRAPASAVCSLDEEVLERLHECSQEGRVVPDDLVENMAVQETVRQILAGLNVADQDLLMLRYVDEFSVRDIAQLWNKSERAIEGLLRRARQRAREIGARYL